MELITVPSVGCFMPMTDIPDELIVEALKVLNSLPCKSEMIYDPETGEIVKLK